MRGRSPDTAAGLLRWLMAAKTGLLPTPPTPLQITKGLSLWLDEKWGSRHRQGVGQDIFKALTDHNGIYSSAAIDSTSVKAHRSAAGAKGALFHSIGRSRGGRTTNIQGLAATSAELARCC